MSKKHQSVESGPVRVATYTRISTDEEHQPFSLEAQAERLGSYLRSQDSWQLIRRYTDQMSGSTLERPGLQQALADARAKRYDMLLVYRVDRLCRSVRALRSSSRSLTTPASASAPQQSPSTPALRRAG